MTTAQRYGRFVIEERLADTALATLYRARDAESGQTVALKVLRAYFAGRADLLDAYFGEVERAAALRHPNILAAVAWGRDPQPWIAMELLPGASLQERIGQPIAIGEVGRIASHIGAALDAAHAAGLTHGDLKPANVFQDATGAYRLADFGMAVLARGADPLTRSTSRTPLPAYMAPEQALDLSVTQRTDVFALGVLLYHLLTGQVPYPATDQATAAARHTFGPPPRPDQLERGVDPPVADVLMRALSLSVERRYALAGELALAFHQAVESTGSAPVRVLVRAQAAPAAAAPAKAASSSEPWAATPERAMCHVCGHLNDPDATHCKRCWAALEPGAVVDEQAVAGMREWRLRRERLLRAGAIAGIAAAVLVGVVAYLLTGGVLQPKSSLTSASAGDSWAMHQANPQHTGYTPGPTPALQGVVRWQVPVPARLTADPVVADGIVYLATGDRRLLALDAATGAIRWQVPLDGVAGAAPAIAGSTIYVALLDSRVLALDRANGQLRWVFRSGGPIYAPPTVNKGLVYVSTGGGTVHALDAVTGDQVWDFAIDDWINSGVAISEDGIAVFGARDGNVYFLDAETGRHRLRFRTVLAVEGGAAIVGDRAYVPTDGGAIVALDLTERRRLFDRQYLRLRNQFWVWNLISDPPRPRGLIWSGCVERRGVVCRGGILATPAVAHGLVYGVTREGQLGALDIETGETKWRFPAGRMSFPAPTVAGETVFVGTDAGKVYGVDARTGQARFEWRAFPGSQISTAAVVVGGTLYAAAMQERVEPELVQDVGGTAPGLAPGERLAGGWYYRYPATLCEGPSPLRGFSPVPGQSQGPLTPFDDRDVALSAARLAAPTCSVLYAVG